MKNLVIIVALLSCSAFTQVLPDAPTPKKPIVIANVAMWSASFVLANSAARGTGACVDELRKIARLDNLFTSAGGGTPHPYRKTLAVALPLDAGISLASFLLRRKHKTAALWLPSVSMGVQFGAAALQYGGGCT